MFIAVKSMPHESIFFKFENEYVAIKSKPKMTQQFCCLYDLDKTNLYRWPEEMMLSLKEEIMSYAKNESFRSVILTGVMNFE